MVRPKLLARPVVKVQFRDFKNGDYKIISFFAKKARGMMARFVVTEQIDQLSGLKDFNLGGYQFSAAASSASELVFLRRQPD